jgi:hypothetical protein
MTSFDLSGLGKGLTAGDYSREVDSVWLRTFKSFPYLYNAIL